MLPVRSGCGFSPYRSSRLILILRVIHLPFPTARLAHIALRALSVDEELSPLVRRSFSIETVPSSARAGSTQQELEVSPLTGGALRMSPDQADSSQDQDVVLSTAYYATTNRMLRVAVNGFLESIGVVICCMRELDEDVVSNDWVGQGDEDIDKLKKVQGLEEAGVLNA